MALELLLFAGVFVFVVGLIYASLGARDRKDEGRDRLDPFDGIRFTHQARDQRTPTGRDR